MSASEDPVQELHCRSPCHSHAACLLQPLPWTRSRRVAAFYAGSFSAACQCHTCISVDLTQSLARGAVIHVFCVMLPWSTVSHAAQPTPSVADRASGLTCLLVCKILWALT